MVDRAYPATLTPALGRARGNELRARAEEHNARFVLLKLNGMAGEW